uniref:ribosomal protein L20 n=1 Tax=Cephaleuros parasiticus TaxID=173370 RepID=UPI001EE02DF8|nr:ribosomal protein L20 [Cephaleuros parasiticus]UIB39037.1 ribosomal protein L20 [Cephaleuros parasiticus]
MTWVKSPRKTKRRTLLIATKGYKKPANNHFRIAHQRFLKAQVHAFRDRHGKKRIFWKLWIIRLNAFLRNSFGLNYSSLIHKLKKSKILTNRKLMTQLSIYDRTFFKFLVQAAE